AKLEVKQKLDAEQREKQERRVVELLQQASALKERMQRAPQAERAEIEAKLREVERNLDEHKRVLEGYREDKGRLAQAINRTAEDESRLREEMEKRDLEQRLESKDRKARLIYHFEPAYPPDAREKKIEGSVVLRFTVNHEGVPQSIQVKKPLYPSLDRAAVEAVSKWRFEPAMKNGELVSMWLEGGVNFNLNQETQTGEGIKSE